MSSKLRILRGFVLRVLRVHPHIRVLFELCQNRYLWKLWLRHCLFGEKPSKSLKKKGVFLGTPHQQQLTLNSPLEYLETIKGLVMPATVLGWLIAQWIVVFLTYRGYI